jgi:hypothetical protein
VSLFAVLNNGGVLGQRAQLMRLHPVFILLSPTRVALASRASVGAFLDRALADGVGQHFGSELVGGGEVDFVAEVTDVARGEAVVITHPLWDLNPANYCERLAGVLSNLEARGLSPKCISAFRAFRFPFELPD